MKLTIKLNIGNYESVDFTTNEYEEGANSYPLYEEIRVFLTEWVDYTNNAQTLLNHVLNIMAKKECADGVDP